MVNPTTLAIPIPKNQLRLLSQSPQTPNSFPNDLLNVFILCSPAPFSPRFASLTVFRVNTDTIVEIRFRVNIIFDKI